MERDDPTHDINFPPLSLAEMLALDIQALINEGRSMPTYNEILEAIKPYILHLLATKLARAEKAERDLAQSREWRPIESAPRDGVKFQTWDAHYGVRIGRCVNRADHDDWLSYMDAHGGSSKGGIRATHWKPLDQTPPTTGSAPS